MNAVPALYAPYDAPAQAPTRTPVLVRGPEEAPIPLELRVLLEESPKMKASFARLGEADRRGFVRYIDEPRGRLTRERRAAIVAMSLIGLARDLREDASPFDHSR